LVWLLASAVGALGTGEAWPAARHHHVPIHLKQAQVHRSKAAEARHYKHGSKHSKRYARLRQSKRRHVASASVPGVSSPVERPATSIPPGLAAVKQALELVRQRRAREATALATSFGDPVAQKLVEWALLRTARYNDAQTMLLMGKTALARGTAMDQYAFPEFGVPLYSAIGPQLDRCVVYSIARTESGFNQRDRSPANAVGLMQVTPEAGRDTAKRFGVAYDWNRLVSDPVYNTQMGAAEVGALLKEYRGSYVMAFAGYNAGRGRVAEWVAKHGDPRDPKVDAVDWVERIPFAETRNYVQRVMENLQVYCARFGASTATVEPNLHRAAPVGSRVNPVLVEAIP
jgi:soluble lytic murein transglycosylase